MACQICLSKSDLTRHHIIPKKAGGMDYPANLVTLCMSCHALVERYYWRVMAQTNPVVAYKFKRLTLGFINKEIPEELFDLAKYRQSELWKELLQPKFNWADLYLKAVQWVKTVTPIRQVSVKDAIIAEPWWKSNDKSKPQ